MDKYSLNRFINPVRKPVKREGAENYLLFTLLSFAASVILTRLFLTITGYPKLGGSDLHIAHVLWGGLLLFFASLLPLIFANRWVYVIGAFSAGIGVGLFIDEVGKFITQNNDYFYPAAAPIIYAFFIIIVLLYIQVRKPPKKDARSELYRALDAIEDVLDHDLDERELSLLVKRLEFVQENADHPDLANLARALINFINSDAIHISPDIPPILLQWKVKIRSLELRWFNQKLFRFILIFGLLGLSIVTLTEITQYLFVLMNTSLLQPVINRLDFASPIHIASGLGWFYTRLLLEVLPAFCYFLEL